MRKQGTIWQASVDYENTHKKVDGCHEGMKIRCTKKAKDHWAGKDEKRMGTSKGWSRGGVCTMQ